VQQRDITIVLTEHYTDVHGSSTDLFGATLSALPTTSNNGITGTGHRTRIIPQRLLILYTTAGQCATTATLTILLIRTSPTFTAVAPICSGATLSALPTTSSNGITGTWSPALDNTATTTYTFTPTAGQCATTATLTIVVNRTSHRRSQLLHRSVQVEH
jgi:hypothetical protein